MFAALLLLALIATIGLMRLEAGVADAAGADPDSGEERLFRVLSPRSDALERGDRLRVKLAMEEGASLQDALLNGKSVTHHFSSRRSGARQVANLSAAGLGKLYPLGRNFLNFIVSRGGERDYEELAFTRVHSTPQLIRGFKVDYERSSGARVKFVPSVEAAQIKVKLNGTNVSEQFDDGTPLKRSVLLGASDGLKHGVNRLTVRAHTHHGEFEKLSRNFTVGGQWPIAGAGPDVSVTAGEVPGLTAEASPDARFRWSLIRRPKGSEARLTARSRRRPVLHTDLPGTYRVRLRTSDRETRESRAARRATASGDVVEVTADAQPLAAVSTFAEAGGKSGIAVEQTRECKGPVAGSKPPCFYPNPGADEDLQVVVVDRDTLEMKSNRAHETTDLSAFRAEMKKFETKQEGSACPAFDDSKLILIAWRAGSFEGFDVGNWSQGRSTFSTRADGEGAGCPNSGGFVPVPPFSAIAVPGALRDKAWTNRGLQINGPDGTPGKTGSLDGLLKRTSDNPARAASTRAFTFPAAIDYNTRRTTDGKAEFVIGSDASPILPGSEPPDADGLSIFSFDPVNPEGSLRREAFITHSSGPATGLAWSKLDAVLESIADKRQGLGITSNGQIGGYASEPEADSFGSVLERLELGWGANADTFARAVNQADGQGTYSLISVPPASRFDLGDVAYQSSSAMAAGVTDVAGVKASDLPVNEGRLTGTLQRGADGRVFPGDGDPSGTEQDTALLPIVYGDQVDWLLTPRPEAAAASCQETAFAYITTQIDGLFPGGAPTLWENPSTDACEGRDHSGTTGPRRADNLDGDSCASEDPAATGARPEDVRSASMTLRNGYLSINTTFDPTQIRDLPRPPDAPFTDADLTCAKNQAIDELAARVQVKEFMRILKTPQENLQRQTVIHLGQIAEDVKTRALAKLEERLKSPPGSTDSFWANVTFGATSAVGTIGAYFALKASALEKGFQILSFAGKGGQTILNVVDGPPGNPVALTNEYILLAAQLDRQAVEIEKQIDQVLSAQANGITQTEAIVLSDPRRMAGVNAKAKGPWQVTAEGLEAAQDAFQYRVTQLAYQAFWPQLYSAFRFSYLDGCQQADNGWWCFASTRTEPDPKWIHGPGKGRPRSPSVSLPGAKNVTCLAARQVLIVWDIARRKYYGNAEPGTPAGLGNGIEYRPQVGVATSGGAPPYEVYVMAQTLHAETPADPGVVEPFFAQPNEPGDLAAGFYAPLFWQQNLQHSQGVKCFPWQNDDRTRVEITTPGRLPDSNKVIDTFYANIKPTEVWPTVAK